MSDSAGEKTFDATPSRIAKAKREGNVARSQEFGANAAFVTAAGVTVGVIGAIGSLGRDAILSAARGRIDTAALMAIAGYALLPGAAAAAAGVVAALVQTGGLTFVPPSFKVERLQPAEGLKRMLSREAVMHAVRAAMAFAIAVCAIAPTLRELLATAVSGDTPAHVASVAWRGAQHVLFAAAAIGLLFAFAEYGSARRAWLQKLKMTFDELKREMKEHDGDPATRSRRRIMHRSLLRGALTKVKDASFVVVNPTHVAIALAYRPPEVPVPTVLVRAAGEAAQRVRELAGRYRIPIVENVPLARTLYRDAEAGRPIPQAQYVAVAEIVAALVRSGVLT